MILRKRASKRELCIIRRPFENRARDIWWVSILGFSSTFEIGIFYFISYLKNELNCSTITQIWKWYWVTNNLYKHQQRMFSLSTLISIIRRPSEKRIRSKKKRKKKKKDRRRRSFNVLSFVHSISPKIWRTGSSLSLPPASSTRGTNPDRWAVGCPYYWSWNRDHPLSRQIVREFAASKANRSSLDPSSVATIFSSLSL